MTATTMSRLGAKVEAGGVMPAIVQRGYGSPDVLSLAEIARPVPGDGEVLVRVRAAAVFYGDAKLVSGKPFALRLALGLRRPKQPILGIDGAGIVEAVGSNVTRLRPGDEVFGWAAGTLAGYVCAGEDHFLVKPANLTFEEAASVPETAMTALQGLRDHGRVEPGQKVLIIGASGGVGTFAVQVARALGAEVTGVCSTRNVELVRSIGADHVIDYTREDVTRSGKRYDVIFQVAGTDSPGRLRRALTPTGTLVPSSGRGRLSGIDRIVKALVLGRFVRQRMAIFMTRENHDDLAAVKELIEAGKVRPVIDRTYPLAEAAEAIRYVDAGHARGRVVITI